MQVPEEVAQKVCALTNVKYMHDTLKFEYKVNAPATDGQSNSAKAENVIPSGFAAVEVFNIPPPFVEVSESATSSLSLCFLPN